MRRIPIDLVDSRLATSVKGFLAFKVGLASRSRRYSAVDAQNLDEDDAQANK